MLQSAAQYLAASSSEHSLAPFDGLNSFVTTKLKPQVWFLCSFFCLTCPLPFPSVHSKNSLRNSLGTQLVHPYVGLAHDPLSTAT